tara:strand:+ start:142 stop:840 length:699 start_codon:yes stop_codon:yes gene_type:complete
MYHFAVFSIISISTLLALESSNDSNAPNKLYQTLNTNGGWSLLNEDGDISIFTKIINDHNISAVMVSQNISIPLDLIQNVIMDVNNYSSILSNAGNMITKAVEIKDSIVIAYQFIPINIPFVDDRHYYFKLKKNKISSEKESLLVNWHLIDKGILKNDFENLEALYISYGAGIWKAKKDNFGKVKLTYRIFMDPNGSMPNFIIDKINEISIINLFKDVIKESEKRFIKRIGE